MKLRLLLAILLLHGFASSAEVKPPAAPPDFTTDPTLPTGAKHDWTLGPTGLRGWYFTAKGQSREARQILVTEVAAGSPAEGVFNKSDVILGVNGTPFSDDARVQFAQAITTAEASDGELKLLRWRAGKTEPVTLRLPVLGSYSATAPYDCPKSQRILELGCAALAERMAAPDYTKGLNPIPRSLNALALLASSKREYLPLIKKEAEWAADFTTDGYLSCDNASDDVLSNLNSNAYT